MKSIVSLGGRRRTQFDPELAREFVDLIKGEYWRHSDLDQFLGEEGSENCYILASANIDRMSSASSSSGDETPM